uniref:Uncharacterized protein n=1 Tax=Rhizophora mucronata TaxID=61149 RepID=A0A2P2PK53_RHIMU
MVGSCGDLMLKAIQQNIIGCYCLWLSLFCANG